MPISQPAGTKKATVSDLISSYPKWVHPDVLYYEDDWRMIRHAYEGQRAVKSAGEVYLPKMASMDADQYTLYLENATFFNMTARTVGALTGTIFARNPTFEGLNATLKEKLSTITKKSQSFRSFTQQVCREVVEMGRVGVLVDTTDGGDPFVTMYVTESLLDWESMTIDGREELTKVILMEMEEITDSNTEYRQFRPIFRVLTIEGGTYKQKIYRNNTSDQPSFQDSYNTMQYPSLDGEPDQIIIPTKRGVPLKKIPFEVIGATAGAWDVQRPPMLDIVDMNMSHYRSYAQLEHGRYYTGFPVFWASKGATDQTNEYQIGPDSVWELPPGEKAGLLEFNGQGLIFLEKAITVKQGHIAALGGRMIGIEVQATAESDNQVAMKDRNEQSLLFEVTVSLDEHFTRIMQIWAHWDSLTVDQAKKVKVEFNKEFMLKSASAREFRAIQSMWQDGLLPLEVVFDYLKKADVIPDWMEIKEFEKLLESNLNNPDLEAKQEGFADARTKQAKEEAEKDRKQEITLEKQKSKDKIVEKKVEIDASEKAAEKAAQVAKDVAEGKGTIEDVSAPDPSKAEVDTEGRRVREAQDANRK